MPGSISHHNILVMPHNKTRRHNGPTIITRHQFQPHVLTIKSYCCILSREIRNLRTICFHTFKALLNLIIQDSTIRWRCRTPIRQSPVSSVTRRTKMNGRSVRTTRRVISRMYFPVINNHFSLVIKCSVIPRCFHFGSRPKQGIKRIQFSKRQWVYRNHILFGNSHNNLRFRHFRIQQSHRFPL